MEGDHILLIVDDDLSTTQTFAQILTMEGYEVHTAATAELGLGRRGVRRSSSEG